MNFWDQRFSEPGYRCGSTPNAFLIEQARRSRVMPALCTGLFCIINLNQGVSP